MLGMFRRNTFSKPTPRDIVARALPLLKDAWSHDAAQALLAQQAFYEACAPLTRKEVDSVLADLWR